MINTFVTNNNNQEVAQKKKKRRNKKKKLVKVAEESSSDSDSDEDLVFMTPQSAVISKPKPKPPLGSYHSNLDDPVTVTIKQVIGKSSYSHERVASCVNRMWDTGLQYDSPEAVLAELQREDDKKVEEQDDYDEILDGKRRAGEFAPVPSLPPPVQVQVSQSSGKAKSGPNAEPTFAKPPALPSLSFGRHTISPAPQPVAPAPAPKSEPQQILSLSQRLDVIASHEDINQALIALNSWCNVTTNAPLSFFQHDCYAVEIILQKFCSEPSLIHDSRIRGQLIALLSHLLPPPSYKANGGTTLQSNHIQSVINALSGLLDQAARSTALKVSTPLTSSNTPTTSHISRLSPLALRLGQSLRKVHQAYEKTRAAFNQNGSIFVIDEDISSLTESINKLQSTLATMTSSSSAIGNGMKEKFELRELIQEVFQLQLKKLEAIQRQQAKSSTSSAASAAPLDPHHLPHTISYSQQDNFAFENAILLASGDSRRNIDALKLQASSSKSYYEKLFQDHENRLVPYQRDLNQLKGQLNDLEERKLKLLAEIQEIDGEMSHLSNKASTIQTFLKELQSQHEQQINSLNTSHGHVVEAIEKDNQVNHLLNNLKQLEQVMDEISSIGLESIATLSQSMHGAGGGGMSSKTTDVLIETFLSYIAVESKCVEFLTKRLLLMKEKMIYSQKEVIEYRNLGMNNLAAEISSNMEKMKENIAEDVTALESLQNTICDLLTSLHSAVRNHAVIRAMPSQPLQEIVAHFLTTDIALRPELAPYNTPFSPPTQTQPPTATPAPTAAHSNTKPPASAPTSAKNPNSETHPQPEKAQEKSSKQVEKSKQAEKKPNDRADNKKANEKKASDKPQPTEKKVAKVAPSQSEAVAAAAAPSTRANKEEKPSQEAKEIPKVVANKTVAMTAAVSAPVEAAAPLPPRTNSKRKPNSTAAPEIAPETPTKAPQQSVKPSTPITPPPGLVKSSDPKSWSGWRPLPEKKKTGSLAQIQAEQASAKKMVDALAAQAVATPLPSVGDFPPLAETKEGQSPSSPSKSLPVDITHPPRQEEPASVILESPPPLPETTATAAEEENQDARSDISIRGNNDELDDDDLDGDDDEKKDEARAENEPTAEVTSDVALEAPQAESASSEVAPIAESQGTSNGSAPSDEANGNAPSEEAKVQVLAAAQDKAQDEEAAAEEDISNGKFDY